MKTIRINVTANDIKEGIQSDCKSCAVALACKRKLNNFAYVGEAEISLGKQISSTAVDDIKNYYLSDRIRKFIVDFDQDKLKVKPTSFQLTVRNKDAKNNK